MSALNYCEIPLAENPSGAPANFVDPPSLIATIQAVGITLGIIALALILLRLYSRLQTGKNALGLDDAFIVVSFIFAVGYTSVVSTFGPTTRHAWDLPMCYLNAAYIKKSFVASVLYGPMLFFAKGSILLLYYRAFNTERWLKWSIYTFMTIMFATYWMTVPLTFNYCMAHSGRAWDLNLLSYCNHLATPGLVQAGMNIAVDIAIIILPLPVIFKLNMPFTKKAGVAVVFATGLFALVASLLTVNYRILIIHSTDSSWAGAQTYICIQAEVYVTLAVACMPSLAKFWTSIFVDFRLYRSFQSLLSRVRGSNATRTARTTFDNASDLPLSNDSVEGRDSHSMDLGSSGNARDRIYKMVTVEVNTAQRV